MTYKGWRLELLNGWTVYVFYPGGEFCCTETSVRIAKKNIDKYEHEA